MEYVARERLEKELGEDIFDINQYSFVKGRSIVHAMVKVASDSKTASERQRYGVMMALDVRNAFNSLSWDAIIKEMRNRGFSRYLIKFVRNYFKERTVCYENSESIIWRKMKMGVTQGSVLGPFFWNIVYDDLLKCETPPMTSRYAFADDVIITVQVATQARLKIRAEKIIGDTQKWMKTKRLTLAEQKTEVIRMNLKRIDEDFKLEIGETKIKPSPYLKYLGVTYD